MKELPKQKNYQRAFDLACASLKTEDLMERARMAGADYRKDGEEERITLPFFSSPHTIRFPRIEFDCPGKKTVSLVVRALLLHYLLKAEGNPLTDRWVAYREIPGCLLYAGVFSRRVTEPLIQKFGRSVDRLGEAGMRLGGKRGATGDLSICFQALPRVPLQYVFWRGDDEFPPAAQLLFDASVAHYLPLEDIAVLGQITTGRLISLSNRLSDVEPVASRALKEK